MPEKSRLKIVHVILSRGFAGSERSTSESCNSQVLNHEVHVIIRKDHRKNGKSIVDHLNSDVIIHELNAYFFTGMQLRKVLNTIKPGVIHCHLRRATRLVSRVSTSAVTVSTLHIEVNGPHFLKMDGLICNARWQVEKIPSEYRGRVFKASNSLVPHRKLSLSELSSLREELGCTEDNFLIGAVGRYHASKGWDTLIKAFAELENTKVRLLFFGTGSLESELKALASSDNRIRFVGYREDIKDIYQCFDLMVCPSLYEPLPRVMLEGYDAGLPMIASDAGGCKELIDDYGGDCFKAGDVKQLASLLQLRCNQSTVVKCEPDLSAHHIENASAALVGLYHELIQAKLRPY